MEINITDVKSRNILIVGVGGQGTLLAGRAIGNLAAGRGFDVKVSEVHGMSQRGGSVVTYVKYAESVASPLIEPGEADIIIAFELLEAARWMHYLRPGGKAAVNSQKIDPMPVISGESRYPDGLEATIRARCPDAVIIDALSAAIACGSTRAVNFVLLGAASAHMGFSQDEWRACIREATPRRGATQRVIDINMSAFSAGSKRTAG